MTLTTALRSLASFPKDIGPEEFVRGSVKSERRQKFRFPLGLPVRFRSSSPDHPFSGAGFATNLSSGGILVASIHETLLGALVEISIEWPFLLNGNIPLQLIVVGRIVRHEVFQEGPYFAATCERYEFRTLKSSTRSE